MYLLTDSQSRLNVGTSERPPTNHLTSIMELLKTGVDKVLDR